MSRSASPADSIELSESVAQLNNVGQSLAVRNARSNVVVDDDDDESRKVVDDFLGRPTFGQMAEHERHLDPVILDGRFPEADLRINDDAFEQLRRSHRANLPHGPTAKASGQPKNP